jgi:hypothetical protein
MRVDELFLVVVAELGVPKALDLIAAMRHVVATAIAHGSIA